jgi:SAM-dependent methyltransferase
MEPTEHNRRAWDEVHRRRAEAMAERLRMPDPVRERLPALGGKHVLHLQCATGDETAELADLGALVTGVDVSSEALELAHERAPTAAFVQADVQDLPLQLRRGRFDLVYSGIGGELGAWAAGIVSALRSGGELIVHDEHPVLACLDERLHWREDYFAADGRRLGELVDALVSAGLVVESVDELPAHDPLLPQARRVPGEVVLAARKP